MLLGRLVRLRLRLEGLEGLEGWRGGLEGDETEAENEDGFGNRVHLRLYLCYPSTFQVNFDYCISLIVFLPVQVPTLALPDGTHISESVSICRYLDLLLPPTSASQPALLGSSPYQAATIDQWIRRVEMRVMSALGNVWINVHPYTKPYSERMGIKRFEDFGEENKGRYLASLKWLDGLFKKSGSGGDNYLADLDPTRKADAKIGFSLADIILLTTVDFGAFIGLPIPKELSGLRDWHERVSARPSVVVEKNQAIHGKL